MKNLQSIEEGKWVELVSIQLTDAEKSVLESPEKSDEKLALIKKIEADTKKSVSASIASKAKAKYNEIKPSLNTDDVYDFISADFMFDGTNITSGILNYRLNEEHKQVRF